MTSSAPVAWVVDSSTYIHFVIIKRFILLASLRQPLHVTKYVYERELCGPRSHDDTRCHAKKSLEQKHFNVESLSLRDLQRIAELGVPRRVAMGEITSAILAERKDGGVLLDDRKALARLRNSVQVSVWESTEDVLIDAAHQLRLTEYELAECESKLLKESYTCEYNLRTEYLKQRLAKNK